MSFRISDGYNPKAKTASMEMLTGGMNMIMNSPLLQQQFGGMLPEIFLHIMQLGGVRDMEQYSPQFQQTLPAANSGVATNTIQTGQPATAVDSATGLPAASTAPNQITP